MTTSPPTVDVPAHLGWRLLAQIVDLAVVVFVFGVVISIFMAGGIDVERQVDSGWLMEITFGAIVFCYFVIFEGLLAATPGKMAAGLRVTMCDGSRPTGLAVVVRNLVRLPELMFWYIPSIISVAASPERRRVGDFAARTMVWRRQPAPEDWRGQGPHYRKAQGGPGPGPRPPGTVVPGGPLVDWPSLAGEACIAAARDLAVAENAYRLMAEREHLRLEQFGLAAAGSEAYSAEYVSAWDALAEAVVGLQDSYHRLIDVLEGQDAAGFVAAHAPLAMALGAVQAYLPAASDEDVVAVFRRRLEAAHGLGA